MSDEILDDRNARKRHRLFQQPQGIVPSELELAYQVVAPSSVNKRFAAGKSYKYDWRTSINTRGGYSGSLFRLPLRIDILPGTRILRTGELHADVTRCKSDETWEFDAISAGYSPQMLARSAY